MSAQNRSAQPAPAELSDLNLEVVSAGKAPAQLGRFVGSTLGGAVGEQLVPSLIQNATASIVSGALGS
jgi:hypothetical protein